MAKFRCECKRLVARLKAGATCTKGNGEKELEDIGEMVEVRRFIRRMRRFIRRKGKEGTRRRNRKLAGRTQLHRNVEGTKAVRAYWCTRDDRDANSSCPKRQCDDVIRRAIRSLRELAFVSRNIEAFFGRGGSES